MADTMRIGFKAVSDLVKSWKTGEYVHHVRHITDKGSFGHEFLVIFSVPHATKPVPEHVANATFTVKVFEADDDKPPKITYTMETQKQKRDGSLPIRKMWLDAAVARKRKVLGDSKMFSNEAKLPPPVPFIPGQYRAEAAVVNSAMDGLDDNQERMLEAMADLGEAQDVAARNEMESVAELEELLVHVFKDADADGNGVLDPKEFSALLDTADLGLDETEKHQLMMLCDVNGDGRIEYAEFAPIGADVIQTMRMRKLNQDEGAVLDAQAELEARKTLHSLGAEEVTSALLRAFKNFDEDGSGRLERAEIEKALQSLTLGPTKLTKKEVRMIMLYIDEDDSGTIEYNEFAPLMFNWMVEALKLGFIQSEADELTMYVVDHCSSYDATNSGTLDYATLKNALFQMDLVSLTPIQVHSLLADAEFDDADRVDLAKFAPSAARLINKFYDPQLEYKRMAVSKMAMITPLQALTAEEKAHLASLAGAVFQQFDEDKSGKLDRFEFSRALTESKLGFTERQIAHLMAAADTSEDGLIDYAEFSDLFNNCILELSRQDAVDKMLAAENGEASQASDLVKLLDELLIPLHLAFDLAAEGADTIDTAKLVDMLSTKMPEMGLGGAAIEALCAGSAALGPSATWAAFVEVVERLAMEAA